MVSNSLLQLFTHSYLQIPSRVHIDCMHLCMLLTIVTKFDHIEEKIGKIHQFDSNNE